MPPRKIEESDLGLKVLVEKPGADVDILAIHGRGAHPNDTWCHLRDPSCDPHLPESYINWLDDPSMLPNVLPTARVMRYGYRSAWFGDEKLITSPREIARDLLEELDAERSNCSDRPLIIIAHSFGGIVAIHLILSARNQCSAICTSLVGLVTFSTPFRGNGVLPQEVLVHLAQDTYGETYERQLDTSSNDSEYLRSLMDDFHAYLAGSVKPRIACFYESQRTNLAVVVDKKRDTNYVLWVNESAGTLDLTDRAFEKHSRPRNHLNVNKFLDTSDNDFQTLTKALLKMYRDGPAIIKERRSAPAGKYCLSLDLQGMPVIDYFTPRDNDMRHLVKFFRSQPGLSRRSTFVVHGMGGIGKSQLCVTFARENVSLFTAIFWLDGSSRATITSSMAKAAMRLPGRKGAEDDLHLLVKEFKKWLAQPDNKGWLLIIDNCDLDPQAKPKDPASYDYKEMLPPRDHGSVLVSTRLSTLGRSSSASLSLESVNEATARSILERQAGSLQDGYDVIELLNRLAGLPLALVQAGSYLAATAMSIREYLKLYDSTWAELMESQREYDLQSEDQRSILTTWKMSYEQVKHRSSSAILLLRIWSFFSPNDIWSELIVFDAAERKDQWGSLPLMSRLQFWDSVGLLARYSLVQGHGRSSSITIHPVVHSWISHVVDSEIGGDSKTRLLFTALGLLSSKYYCHYADKSSLTYWQTYRRIMEHSRALCSKLKSLPASQVLFPSHIYTVLAICVYESGNLEDAELLLPTGENAFQNFATLPPSGAQHIMLVYSVSLLYHARGQFKLEQRLLELALRAIGTPERAHVLSRLEIEIMLSLGENLEAQGQPRSAAEFFGKAFATAVELDIDGCVLVNAASKLSMMQTMRAADESESILRWAIQYSSPLPELRHSCACARAALAKLYLFQRKLEKALPLLKMVSQAYKEYLGEDLAGARKVTLQLKWTREMLNRQKQMERVMNKPPDVPIAARLSKETEINAQPSTWVHSGTLNSQMQDQFDKVPLALQRLLTLSEGRLVARNDISDAWIVRTPAAPTA